MPDKKKVAKTGDTVKVTNGLLKDKYLVVKDRKTSTTVEVLINGKSCTLRDQDIKVVW